MIVFKKLFHSISEVNKKLELDNFTTDREKKEFQDKYEVLSKILTYFETYEWLKHERTKERVRVFIKSGYNYKGCADHFGISLTAFQSSICYSASKFEERIGKDTIDLVMSGDITAALFQFNVGVGKFSLTSLVPQGVDGLIPKAKMDILLNLDECQDELIFLKLISLPLIKQRAAKLDNEKLAHIRYILESTDSRYAKMREALYLFLFGKVKKVDDLLILLSNK